ncbi:cytochrome P450 [Saccharopolyspora sp. NFXS83]|uniref:cytochrome P450 n=1 Tax=Saccharopolyspora sp. NFXS83 TaxID=2993560 RepID=UPI00224ADC26|nr:cytochrome P450 [Saccharopolyspora sp. NFXS83]MCX2730156.1 cytochrome P450 [Saccharopolyspora sp. NFXS83]
MKTRAALTPRFSAKRMVALRARVAERVAEHLDRLTASAPPVDLHAELSLPLPFEVLCDLLGVAEYDRFMAMLAGSGRLDESEEVAVGAQELFAYLGELVTTKRREPDEHLISALREAEIDDGTVCELISTISFSYLVTPTNLSAGIALFASHPEQRERVVRDPGLLETAVEEVLRLSKVDESFQPRYAGEDIEIGGIVIKAGDLVLCGHYSP